MSYQPYNNNPQYIAPIAPRAPVIPPGARQHMAALPLEANGTATECIILKRYPNKDMVFIPVNSMDQIDRERIKKFLGEPHCEKFELWDLLSHRQLGNGQNALEYFHQLAKYFNVRTGKVSRIDPAVAGIR